MMEEPTSVYEIELAGRQRFRENVVASRLKVGAPYFTERRGVTCSLSHSAIEPPPAPTSRQRQPGARPSAAALRLVFGSRENSSSARRRFALSQELSSA